MVIKTGSPRKKAGSKGTASGRTDKDGAAVVKLLTRTMFTQDQVSLIRRADAADTLFNRRTDKEGQISLADSLISGRTDKDGAAPPHNGPMKVIKHH